MNAAVPDDGSTRVTEVESLPGDVTLSVTLSVTSAVTVSVAALSFDECFFSRACEAVV